VAKADEQVRAQLPLGKFKHFQLMLCYCGMLEVTVFVSRGLAMLSLCPACRTPAARATTTADSSPY
jgi:hypothetical protein